jgi:hypothetical protein
MARTQLALIVIALILVALIGLAVLFLAPPRPAQGQLYESYSSSGSTAAGRAMST